MVKRKLRIAIFHLGFFYSGGGERLVIEEARGLTKLGHDVVVFAPVVDRKESFPELIKRITVKSLFWQLPVRLPFRDGLVIILSCLSFPLQLWRFRKYDIYFGANQPGAYFAWLAAKFWGKRHFIYLAQPNRLLYPRKIDSEQKMRIRERDYVLLVGIRNLFGGIIAWLDRRSTEEASVVFANGEFAAENLRCVYNVDPLICPAGCHSIKSRRVQTGKGVIRVNGHKIRKPYILITNRHYPQKKFEYVISGMPFIKRKVALVITGKATRYTQYLQMLVKQLGLEGRVKFLGFVSEKHLKRLYLNARVYVYPSPEEDFGMGIIEAMATGCPVVAWNFGGPKFIIDNGKDGLLAEPYKEEDLIDKIKSILINDKLAVSISRAALRKAKEKYSYTAHAEFLKKYFLKNYE